jgi:hypothetical protein
MPSIPALLDVVAACPYRIVLPSSSTLKAKSLDAAYLGDRLLDIEISGGLMSGI